MRIVALCLGREMVPFAVPVHGGANLDSETMEQIVKARLDNAMASAHQELARDREEIQKERAELAAMLKETRELLDSRKKVGRPKGSKNRPKAPAEPELTEDQQKMLAKMDFGPTTIAD